MTGERTAKKDRDPIFTICLAIFAIAAIIAVGAFINNEYLATGDEKASTGDKVSVNYTGTFYDAYGQPNAVVFDTSYWSVADDDDIAKSNDFTKKSKSSYTPLSFTIGKGTMLADFENSVIGHVAGDKYSIQIDAASGYVGASTEGTLNETGNIMAASFTMPYSKFHTAYADVAISGKTGVITFETKFGWDATAQLTDGGNSVLVTYMPEIDKAYTVYESGSTTVTYTVTAIGDNQLTYNIKIDNPVTVDNAGHIQMIKLDLGEETIYITQILGGTITYKEGSERVNQPLFFDIEVVSVEKA